MTCRLETEAKRNNVVINPESPCLLEEFETSDTIQGVGHCKRCFRCANYPDTGVVLYEDVVQPDTD